MIIDLFRNADGLKNDLRNIVGLSTESISAFTEMPLSENKTQASILGTITISLDDFSEIISYTLICVKKSGVTEWLISVDNSSFSVIYLFNNVGSLLNQIIIFQPMMLVIIKIIIERIIKNKLAECQIISQNDSYT